MYFPGRGQPGKAGQTYTCAEFMAKHLRIRCLLGRLLLGRITRFCLCRSLGGGHGLFLRFDP